MILCVSYVKIHPHVSVFTNTTLASYWSAWSHLGFSNSSSPCHQHTQMHPPPTLHFVPGNGSKMQKCLDPSLSGKKKMCCLFIKFLRRLQPFQLDRSCLSVCLGITLIWFLFSPLTADSQYWLSSPCCEVRSSTALGADSLTLRPLYLFKLVDQSLLHHFCFKGDIKCQKMCNVFYLRDTHNAYRLVCDGINYSLLRNKLNVHRK